MFAPRSIALVGVSERSLWSTLILDGLGLMGFDGRLELVNPLRPEVRGRRAQASLAEIAAMMAAVCSRARSSSATVSASEVMIVILHPDPRLAASPADAYRGRGGPPDGVQCRGRPIDIEQLGLECPYRALTITRKGGKVVTISLAPRTARAIDPATGDGTDGPIFLILTGGA